MLRIVARRDELTIATAAVVRLAGELRLEALPIVEAVELIGAPPSAKLNPGAARARGTLRRSHRESSRAYADDRLPRASPGRVECRDGVVEIRDAYRCSSAAARRGPAGRSHSAGHDRTLRRSRPPVRCRAASGGPTIDTSVPPARIRRAERVPMSPPMRSNTRSTPPTSSSAPVSRSTNSFAPKPSGRLTVGGASGADDPGAGLPRELRRHRADRARRAVHEHALPRLEAAMLEQALPRGQSRDRQARALLKSTSPGSGARLRASTATYSARVPSRYQSVRPNTRCPTDSPVVP